VSLTDAARRVGVAERTVKHWLTRGRREPGSVYAGFLAEVEGARDGAGDVGEMGEGEFREAVARAVREGSVPAMKLMWEMLRADQADPDAKNEKPVDPLAEFDQLAQRRSARTG